MFLPAPLLSPTRFSGGRGVMKALQYAKDEAKKPYTAELAKLEARHAATILPATQLAAAAMLEAAQGVYRGLLQMSNIIDLRRMLAAETKSGNELTLALTAISASSGGGRGSSAASSAGAGGGGGGGGSGGGSGRRRRRYGRRC